MDIYLFTIYFRGSYTSISIKGSHCSSISKTLQRKLKNALCYVRLIDLFPVKNFSIKKTFNRFISPSLKSFSSWPSFLYQIELQIVYFLFFLSENFFPPKANSWKYIRKGNDIAYFRFLAAFIFLPITWWI